MLPAVIITKQIELHLTSRDNTRRPDTSLQVIIPRLVDRTQSLMQDWKGLIVAR